MSVPLVFVIGDSISMHYGPYLEKMLWPRWAYARKTGREAALKAAQDANGGDSSAVLSYIEAMAADEAWRPGLLLLNCGLHDTRGDPKTGAKQVPLERYCQNLRMIVRIVGQIRVPMIWIRITPVHEQRHKSLAKEFLRFPADVEAYNAAADEIMTEAEAPILDLHGFTAALEGEIFCDHVHFTEPVRRLQAAFIAGCVQAFFALRG